MGKVTVLDTTTKKPITLIGERAGICYNADTQDSEKNFKRGIECISANHGRAFEYINVELIIEGYSARVIREWYTHTGGAPTRLQTSTRYIDYKNFHYVTPPVIENDIAARTIYQQCMSYIAEASKTLEIIGIPREDIAMLLPLGMETKIIDKRNLRSLIDMSRQRMCSRAYHEYRQLFSEICYVLKEYSEEWRYIINTLMKPKCEVIGNCTEKKSCGRFKQRSTTDEKISN